MIKVLTRMILPMMDIFLDDHSTSLWFLEVKSLFSIILLSMPFAEIMMLKCLTWLLNLMFQRRGILELFKDKASVLFLLIDACDNLLYLLMMFIIVKTSSLDVKPSTQSLANASDFMGYFPIVDIPDILLLTVLRNTSKVIL